MNKSKGKVFLVGAGPGDIGLLTIKGLKCLQTAEVVVYDFHLNAQVLNFINSSAEFIYAGKRGGHHTMTQDEINAVLVEKALEGKVICRLKGGDPFVFGRGGEEAEALAAEGIEFEVVPGISSSIAAPAYAGIPLTHRKYSSSFAVIPGYEDTTKEGSSIDWARLATGVGTLVFLMAVKNIETLTKKLIENGRSPDTPVAIIRWGTRADQATLTTTLGQMVSEVKAREIKPPAVIVVGEVVRLRETLNWFERKPLFGQRILVTREHSYGFEQLEDMGAEVVAFPTVEIVPPEDMYELDAAIKRIASAGSRPAYDWLILTSGNGVKYFFGRLFELGVDIRDLKGIRICAVGSKTAEKIQEFGIKVDLVPEEFRAEGLVNAFARMGGGGDRPLHGMKFLLPRAEVAREVFPEKIRDMGGVIDVTPAYRAVIPSHRGKRIKRFLQEGKITVATFTSAATFRNFMEMVGDDAEDLLRGVAIAVIGPVTARAIQKAGLVVDIMPEESTVEAMVAEVVEWALSKGMN